MFRMFEYAMFAYFLFNLLEIELRNSNVLIYMFPDLRIVGFGMSNFRMCSFQHFEFRDFDLSKSLSYEAPNYEFRFSNFEFTSF